MAKAPGFIFYPGDYLRDTQCLSEVVQVAYDRIMCEHMRNICISQQQLTFFTKRLTILEKQELAMVLTQTEEGFQIGWVAESIEKYRAYTKSRSENRKGKTKNTSKSYVRHMENENESINEDEINQDRSTEERIMIGPDMVRIFKEAFPGYFIDEGKDYSSCLQIGEKIALIKKWTKESITNGRQVDVTQIWVDMVSFAKGDHWYSKKSISFINDKFQDFIQAFNNQSDGTNQQRTAKSNDKSGASARQVSGLKKLREDFLGGTPK